MKKILFITFILVLFSGFALAQRSVTLIWTNSISEAVTGYNLYRSETAGSGYAIVNTKLIPSDPLGHSEWTDETVKNNRRYFYVCRAVAEWVDPYTGDSGTVESINSNEATTYIMPPAPNPPTGLIKKFSTP